MSKAANIYNENGAELREWIERECSDELAKLCERYPSGKSTFIVDWEELHTHNHALADDAIGKPEVVREALHMAVTDAAPQNGLRDGKDDNDNVIRGKELDVVFTNAGVPMDVSMLIRGDHVGNLVTLRGQCTKATDTRPKLTTAALRCNNCGVMSMVDQPTHGSNEPNACASCESSGRNLDWDPDLDNSEWTYHQLVRIKHQPGESDADSYVDVHLTGDMAGVLNGGESVDITGVLKDVWPDGLDSGQPEWILEGDVVRKHESDFESIDVASHKERVKALARGEEGNPFTLLTESIAPGIFGGELMDRIKLALACQLFGGKRIENGDGTAFRGDIHQLLVGAPGTGKSSLQDAVAEYSPRVSTVSGKNASKAGITAAAVRDDFGDTEWSIEAGAIVKAHKGICIIDELDKVDGDALSSLHSALERQKLSVAKAGINANLKCETALLGAANPEHERFIDEHALIDQIPVGSAMRSRLDATFLLKDRVDERDDREKVGHMLNSLASGEGVSTVNFSEEDEITAPLTKEEIQAWVAYARQHHDVAFGMETLKDRVTDYYVQIRQDSAGSGAPVTIRKVGAIIRYATASARIRLGDRVTDSDIQRGIDIVGASLAQIGMTEDGELSGDAGISKAVKRAKDQNDRVDAIKEAASDPKTPAEIAQETGVDEGIVNDQIEMLLRKGLMCEPKTGEYRTT